MRKIGRITISDRASAGVYEDRSGPEIERVMGELWGTEMNCISCVVPDEVEEISHALLKMADEEFCALIVTTGGTGIGPRDVTPEATRAILEKELPGFGEIMRIQSFRVAPTAPLSRAVAGIRGRSLIINLPGSPKAVRECLEILGPAIKEALRHLSGDGTH